MAGPKSSKTAATTPEPKRAPAPEHLFRAWDKITRRIHSSKRIVLFLDFDGTLVRLRQDPEAVSLEGHVRSVLNELSAHPKFVLCLISGRKLDDLQKRARVDGAIYFGLHGFERSNKKVEPSPRALKLRSEMRRLQQTIQGLPGIRIEDKNACFAIHYRTASRSSVEIAEAAVEKSMNRLGRNFRLMSGKKIWEIYPREIGSKGKAALDLLKGFSGRKLVIYAGDDTTDETAFRALRGAVTIRVGQPDSTRARYFLNDPEEVLEFLKRLQISLD